MTPGLEATVDSLAFKKKNMVSSRHFVDSYTTSYETRCSVVQKSFVSDEGNVCISSGSQAPRVWRKRGEAQNPSCSKSGVKFPQ